MTSRHVLVKVAQFAVGTDGDVLVTHGLGSCVAIILHDAAAGVGAMGHILLPAPLIARDAPNHAKFASTAVPLLVAEIERAGASIPRLGVRLVGGASMFGSLMEPGSRSVGERNIAAVREALEMLSLPILAEDVGGDYGRSVRFSAGGGRLVVSSVYRDDVIL
jgi:chemotaxis protein CheD